MLSFDLDVAYEGKTIFSKDHVVHIHHALVESGVQRVDTLHKFSRIHFLLFFFFSVFTLICLLLIIRRGEGMNAERIELDTLDIMEERDLEVTSQAMLCDVLCCCLPFEGFLESRDQKEAFVAGLYCDNSLVISFFVLFNLDSLLSFFSRLFFQQNIDFYPSRISENVPSIVYIGLYLLRPDSPLRHQTL